MHTYKKVKVKGKVHSRTGHDGPEGEYMYSSTLTSTSALDGWVVNATPQPIYPRERTATHRIGGWVDHRSDLDGCGKSRFHRYSIPEPSSPYRFAIPAHSTPDLTCIFKRLHPFRPVFPPKN